MLSLNLQWRTTEAKRHQLLFTVETVLPGPQLAACGHYHQEKTASVSQLVRPCSWSCFAYFSVGQRHFKPTSAIWRYIFYPIRSVPPNLPPPRPGREVLLWPDDDDAGKRYAERIAEIIEPLASSVSTVAVDALWLPERADYSDCLTLHPSLGVEELSRLERVKKTASGRHYNPPTAVIVCSDAVTIAPVDSGMGGWPLASCICLAGNQAQKRRRLRSL